MILLTDDDNLTAILIGWDKFTNEFQMALSYLARIINEVELEINFDFERIYTFTIKNSCIYYDTTNGWEKMSYDEYFQLFLKYPIIDE